MNLGKCCENWAVHGPPNLSQAKHHPGYHLPQLPWATPLIRTHSGGIASWAAVLFDNSKDRRKEALEVFLNYIRLFVLPRPDDLIRIPLKTGDAIDFSLPEGRATLLSNQALSDVVKVMKVLDPVRNSGVWTDYLVANVVAASCIDTLLQVELTQMPELIDADVTKLAEPFWAPSSAEQSGQHTINSLFTRGEHNQSAPSSQVNTEVAAGALRSIVSYIWGHEKWRIERKQFMLALLKDFAASSGTWKNLRAKTQDSPATSSVYDDRNLISEKFAEFYVTEIGTKGLLSLGFLSQLASDRVFNLTVLNKLHNNNVIDDAEYDAAKRSLHASPPQRKFSQNIVPLKQALESLQKIDGPQ